MNLLLVSEFVQLTKDKGLLRGLSFCLAHGIMEWWNIGMVVFKGGFAFFNILNFLVSMNFTNNPLYHFPITQYSTLPLFQHSIGA